MNVCAHCGTTPADHFACEDFLDAEGRPAWFCSRRCHVLKHQEAGHAGWMGANPDRAPWEA